MSEEGEILGVPFKLERRPLQDQIMEASGRVSMLTKRVEILELILRGQDPPDFPDSKVTGLAERVAALERLHGTGEEAEPHTYHNRLQWTREVPKKPGFYWCRLKGRRTFPCEMVLKDGNPYVKLLCEPEMTSVAWMMPGAEWYGPVEPPE